MYIQYALQGLGIVGMIRPTTVRVFFMKFVGVYVGSHSILPIAGGISEFPSPFRMTRRFMTGDLPWDPTRSQQLG